MKGINLEPGKISGLNPAKGTIPKSFQIYARLK